MIKEELTERIIGCAMEVHAALGPGLLESNYQAAMGLELSAAGLSFARERLVPVVYRGVEIGQHRPDFVIENTVVVEIKSVERYDPVFAAQVITYLRITKLRVGLLFNFNRPTLKDGIKRFVLRIVFSVPPCLRGPSGTAAAPAGLRDREHGRRRRIKSVERYDPVFAAQVLAYI